MWITRERVDDDLRAGAASVSLAPTRSGATERRTLCANTAISWINSLFVWKSGRQCR